MPLAHRVVAKIYTFFNKVVESLSRCGICSNIYLEILDINPATAIAVGKVLL